MHRRKRNRVGAWISKKSNRVQGTRYNGDRLTVGQQGVMLRLAFYLNELETVGLLTRRVTVSSLSITKRLRLHEIIE